MHWNKLKNWEKAIFVALLVLAIFGFFLFDVNEAFVANENFGGMAVVLLLLLPLAYSGVALLGVRSESAEDKEEES